MAVTKPKAVNLKSTLPPKALEKILSGQSAVSLGKVVTINTSDDDPRLYYPKGYVRKVTR